MPFAAAPGAIGFEMAYVSGSGIDEVWGLRAKYLGEKFNPEDSGEVEHGLPEDVNFSYNYATLYTQNAYLTLQKLEAGAGDMTTQPDTSTLKWDGVNHVWVIPANPDTGSTDTVPFTAIVQPYTAEINVTGKAIYGYNWQLRSTEMNPDEAKGGWWRLTFSTDPIEGGAYPIQFTDGAAPALSSAAIDDTPGRRCHAQGPRVPQGLNGPCGAASACATAARMFEK